MPESKMNDDATMMPDDPAAESVMPEDDDMSHLTPIELTEEEANKFRDQFLYDIYPEIGRYLESDLRTILAQNLQVPARKIATEWRKSGLLSGVKNIVQGRTKKRDGTDLACHKKPYGFSN